LNSIPSPFLEQVEAKLLALADNPRPAGRKKLQGEDNLWRIRSGKYRIVYEISDAALIVTAIKIGHRRDIYR